MNIRKGRYNLRNRIGFTFYAIEENQIYNNLIDKFKNVELTLFNKEDLFGERFSKFNNILEKVTKLYNKNNISLHFPINESEYHSEEKIRKKLYEYISIADNYGIKTVTIHSNNIRKLHNISIEEIELNRRKIVGELSNIAIKKNNVNICIENMSILGNFLDDSDPIFICADDFKYIIESPLYITFDLCHFFINDYILKNTLSFNSEYLRYIKNKKFTLVEYERVFNKIKHIHLSSYKVINGIIREGKTINEGDVCKEEFFKNLDILLNNVDKESKLILEINELDYRNRKNIFKMNEELLIKYE